MQPESSKLPRLKFPEDYDKKTTAEVFKLPAWVNRVAKLGDKVVPDFIFNKILEKLMPPVRDNAVDDEDPPAASSAGVSNNTTTRNNGGKQPASTSPAASSATNANDRTPPASAVDSALPSSSSFTQTSVPSSRPPPLEEQPDETPMVAAIADAIGVDLPTHRSRILVELRRAKGVPDLAVQRLLMTQSPS